MRYSFYVFVKQLANSIDEALLYIRSSKKPLNSVGMLVDCAEAIGKIKDVLVKNEKSLKDISGIDLLDKAKNIIDVIAEKVERNEEFLGELDKLINNSNLFKEFVQNKIDFRYKFVFFAELGSKWDSMASVYDACVSRDDCEVEVVIAPIFRAIKDKDGKVISDVIYNDFLTPLGIRHTLYKDYDIKKDLPDIVFTSQPYESVTTEQFWAENIAKYTRLVYLPYATFKSMPPTETYVQSQMPIHKLAWRIICQSEKAKKIYSKSSPVGGKNILVTGLPKWDYVVNLNKRDIDMPEKWKSKLEGKKVFLFNIHYSANSPEIVFKQLEFVYRLKNFDNSAIIIRYHPMLDTIFKVYFKDKLHEWEKIKADINKLPYAVIDNNTSYEYAFKFSDALITAFSSIITQYLIMNKPILILYQKKEKQQELDNADYVFERYSLLEFTENSTTDNRFINNICNGIDEGKNEREQLIKEALPNLDGKIGERVVNLLIDEMKKEDL